MKNFGLFRMLALLELVASMVAGQPMAAQGSQRWHKHIAPRENSTTNTDGPKMTPTPNLYSLEAALVQDNPTIGANSDGSDLWPCLQVYQGGPGSNPDCATLGNPSIPTPTIATVLGIPAFVWPLKNTQGVGNGFGCDAFSNGTTGPSPSQYIPCAQFETWYEDDTNDSTDDLLQRIIVRQDDRVVYDSGVVDFGPAGPTVKYPVDVILAADANFSFWPGANVGPNNGNCSTDFNYPLTAPTNPGLYVVEGGSTCGKPSSGPAKVVSFTGLGTPAYTKATGTACTSKGVASPCYVVKWTKKYEIWQNWSAFFQ